MSCASTTTNAFTSSATLSGQDTAFSCRSAAAIASAAGVAIFCASAPVAVGGGDLSAVKNLPVAASAGPRICKYCVVNRDGGFVVPVVAVVASCEAPLAHAPAIATPRRTTTSVRARLQGLLHLARCTTALEVMLGSD